MRKELINNLIVHFYKLSSTLINQISSENVILMLDENDNVYPDAVSNHHLIDLFTELDSGIFSHYCNSLFKWLASSKSGYSDHPFTLDSFSKFCVRNEENNSLYSSYISRNQNKDGAIPIYTALLQGGDFFSTLWATKILVQYDKEYFKKEIELSLNYLFKQKEIAPRNTSQLGFLLFVLLNYNASVYKSDIDELYILIKDLVLKSEFKGNVLEVMNEIYLLEDLLEYYKIFPNKKDLEIIENKINILFQLENEPDLPEIFERLSTTKPQAPYYQTLLKSAVVVIKYLKLFSENNFALELNDYLHSSYRQIKYSGLQAEKILKEYKMEFDGIKNEFKKYDAHLIKLWEQCEASYDKSIFLMMPFKSDYNFRGLTKFIKDECLKYGYKVYRVDDKFRAPFDTLWDNIVLNMLACRFGISIYVSEKSLDKLTDELRFFENPNVALEYGFMKARGKKVLILKDVKSKTPSDLQGFVWKPFDIKNPDKTIPNAIKSWINETVELSE